MRRNAPACDKHTQKGNLPSQMSFRVCTRMRHCCHGNVVALKVWSRKKNLTMLAPSKQSKQQKTNLGNIFLQPDIACVVGVLYSSKFPTGPTHACLNKNQRFFGFEVCVGVRATYHKLTGWGTASPTEIHDELFLDSA